jgi:hypothetical protein
MLPKNDLKKEIKNIPCNSHKKLTTKTRTKVVVFIHKTVISHFEERFWNPIRRANHKKTKNKIKYIQNHNLIILIIY